MKQQKKQRGITVFFSYAQADQAARDQLSIHLSLLKRDRLIEEWSDLQVLAGSDRAQEIDQAIHSAHIILLLISADFLASDTYYDQEMQQALERHKRGEARVIPIIVRPCDWQHTPFAHLQCLPRNTKPVTTWDNQDEAFVAIAQDLRKVIAQQQFPPPLLPQIERQNRMRLLKRVRATWIEGLLEQSLHRAAWIDLHFQEHPDTLDPPWRFQVQELHHAPYPLPINTSIVGIYDEADGELLILGEPGAGKTTLLLHLTRTLLDRAEVDERQPMPVVFNLSSWIGGKRLRSPDEWIPFAAWLVEELNTKYRVPEQVGWDWIDGNRILPLLDGLDEVDEEKRLNCVQMISAYYTEVSRHPNQEHGWLSPVVCCRSEEYWALPEQLPLQRAVSILPLTAEQIDGYLASAEYQLDALRQVLHNDSELFALARRPLMLNIFTLAYQGASLADLPAGLRYEQTLHLVFEHYIKRMLTRREQLQRWKQEQFLSWLTYIVRQLSRQHQSIFLVEDIQPNWLSDRQQKLYQWGLTLLVGLLIGLLIGLPFVLFVGFVIKQLVGLLAGLFIGQFLGLFSGSVKWKVTAKQRDPEGIVLNAPQKKVFSKLQSGLFSGLLIGMVGIAILLFHHDGWVVGPVLGLPAGLLVGRSFQRKGQIRPREVVTWSWGKVRNNKALWLVGGLYFGLVGGVIGGLLIGPVDGIFLGLFVGLIFMLPIGLSGSQILSRIHLSPNEGIWLSGKNGIVVGLLFALVGALLGGLFVGLAGGLLVGLQGALLLGLLAGLLAALFVGLGAFFQHFALRLWLWALRRLPWNIVTFLDEAAERLILRKVGGSYIFVHRLLFEYFASLDETTSTEHKSREDKRRC